MSRLTANINPDFLNWARKEAGYETNEIAIKLGVKEDSYLDWETTGLRVPVGKLKLICTYYKRQIASFFLPYIPESTPKPKDFRNLSVEESKLSKSFLLTLRRVNQIRNAAIEIKDNEYWTSKYDWISELRPLHEQSNNEPLIIHSWLRERLDITIEQQCEFKDARELYNSFRSKIEEHLGILVLQFSLPMNEAHGFSKIDKKPYVIVTNSKHTYSGRIFTLFHELAHILNNQEGLCLIDQFNESNEIEITCNGFAGKFLVPDRHVIPVDSLAHIVKLSNKFNVSREVYLRRVKESGLISNTLFFDLLEEIKASYAKMKEPGGFAPPEVKSRASRGPTFYNLVLEGLNTNRINYTDASQLLDLKINRILSEL